MKRTLTVLFLVVFALLAVGTVVLASAGGVNGLRLHHDAYHFVRFQAYWLIGGTLAACCAAFFDYHNWRDHRWLTYLLYAGVIVLMVVVLKSRAINGSHRWLTLFGPVRIQPGELAKITTVIVSAVYLDCCGARLDRFWKGVCPAGLLIGTLMALAVKEPDFGSTAVILATGGALLFLAGLRWRYILSVGGLAVAAVGTLLYFDSNRMNRILAFWTEDASNSAYHQLHQALVAIQRGGLTGVGYCQSMQKELYLPEAHTDFIFAIGAEELGLVFSIVLLALFVTVFVCGMRIAEHAPDRLGRFMSFGVTFLLFFQVVFNIAVVTGLFPTKGLALPFISYGGTNLVTALVCIGVLFNVGRQIELQKPRPKSTISTVVSTQGGN